jgi:hypothetical protein
MCAPSRVSSFVRIRLHIKEAAIIIVHITAKILMYRSMRDIGCIIFSESSNLCHPRMPYFITNKHAHTKPCITLPSSSIKEEILNLSPGGQGEGVFTTNSLVTIQYF